MGIVTSCLNASSRQLLSAASDGDADTVRQILEAKPQLATYSAFTTGWNCLHYAAAKGHTVVLQAAIEAVKMGSKESLSDETDDISMKSVRAWSKLLKDCLNQKGSRGESAVMVACEEGHGFAAKFLIEQGADPFVQDKTQHRSAIHYAAAKGKSDSLRQLLDDHLRIHTEEGYQSLKNARIQDVSGNCRYIDSRAENGLTALHLAAVNGSLECVRLLLDGGASMMVRTVDLDVVSDVAAPAGSTPLHVAAMTGHVAILQAMLQAHSDALGSWGDNGATARRAWEGDGRIDLRSVTNCLRQLPYHVAWQKGYRQAAGVLNPTVPIDSALETCRELGEGFGPQKLSVLAAYCLRQSLLVWLKAYKADIELGGLDPRTGLRPPAMNGQPSPIEQAAAAAVADAARSQLANVPQSPPALQQSQQSFRQRASASGRQVDPFEMEPLVNSQPQSSRTLQGPTFSSNAFPSVPDPNVQSPAALSPTVLPPTAIPSPFAANNHRSVSMNSNMSAGGIPGGLTPRPRRAAPPPPIASSPFAMVSPFAQASEQATDAGYPGFQRSNSTKSSFTDRTGDEPSRPTVRFADAGAPAAASSRQYNHTNSAGFTELALSRSQDGSQVPGHRRNRSGSAMKDSFSGGRSGLRPAHSRSLSRQERAASASLDVLDLPALPLPQEAVAQAEELGSPVVSPSVSRQPSRQLSLMRQMSGYRRSRSLAGSRQPSMRATSRQPSMIARAASVAGFEDDYGGDCGICLDEPEAVEINGCNHRLCVDCSISLCEVHKKPPLCPFCRAMISGFHELSPNQYFVR